jgi:ankyrin repeat protein
LKAERPDLLRWVAANGHWRAVPLLIELGFDVNAAVRGVTALHHAAAAHRLDEAQLLVEHGAHTHRLDDHFKATPMGWAEYFHNQLLVDYLQTVTA